MLCHSQKTHRQTSSPYDTIHFSSGYSAVGSALCLGRRGPQFESGYPDRFYRTCGYGVMVARDPSKVSVRVRISLPASTNPPFFRQVAYLGL